MIIRKQKRYDYCMTYIGLVVVKDRIVAVADGRAVDDETQEVVDDVQKIFRLNDKTFLMLTGRVLDGMLQRIETLEFALKFDKREKFIDIVNFLESFLNSFDWDEGHLTFIVAGYSNEFPMVRMLTSGKPIVPIKPRFIGAGSLDANVTSKRLHKLIGDGKISLEIAENALFTVLGEAEKQVPEEVGGKTQMIYLFPDGRFEKVDYKYIKKLRTRNILKRLK